MAFTSGNDINVLSASDSVTVGAGAGNDRYVLSPGQALGANQIINITDTQGTNTLQLIGGLTITSSIVSATSLQLKLSNGATVNVFGANTFSFEVGGNPLLGTPGTVQNFATFAVTSLGVTAVPTTGTANGAANVGVNANGTTTVGGTPVDPTDPGTPLNSYVLTAGLDNVTANKFFASQTQFNVDGKGPTLNAGDTLTGTAGRTDNQLTVTDLTAGVNNNNIPAGVTLNNIQNIVLNTSGNTATGTGFSTVGYDSVRSLTGVTNGGNNDIFVAKNDVTTGTAVNITHNGFTGSTNVVGGTDVTVTSAGAANPAVVPATGNAGILVGSTDAGIVPTEAQVTKGAITVNQNNTGGGNVRVLGGTTVNVTTSSTSNTGNIDIGNTGGASGNSGGGTAGAIANASGNITVSTKGTGIVTAFGGKDVSITSTATKGAGAITVGDITYAAASNLATGNVTITETAAIAFNGQAGSSNNSANAGDISVYGGKNVTITTNAANNINIGNLGTKENTLNPTGAITVTNTGIVTKQGLVVPLTPANDQLGVIKITGGTDVTVTTTGADVTIGRAANNAVDQVSNPTGNVVVTETRNGNGLGTKTVTIDGGKDITVNAKGQEVKIGTSALSSATGAVVVNQSDVLTGSGFVNGTGKGNVTVDGGTTVNVNTTGGNVTVGGTVAGVVAVPSGAVNVVHTSSGPSSDTTTVLGGTSVNITTSTTSGAIKVGAATILIPGGAPLRVDAPTNVAGTALKDVGQYATGDVTIVNTTTSGAWTTFGTGQVDVYTNGAKTVSIKGGSVNQIFDVQSTLGSNGKALGTSTLKTVIVDSQQGNVGFGIQSDALTELSILNNKTSSATIAALVNNTTAHTLTVTQGGNLGTATTGQINLSDATATAIVVNDNGVASTAVLALGAAKATSLTVNNAAAATLDVTGDAALTTIVLKGAGATTLKAVETLTKVTSIDATASTGAVTTSLAATTTNGVSQKFTGGSGVVNLTVTTNVGTWGDGVVLTGGTGTADILTVNYASAVGQTAMGSVSNVIKGFEILGLGALANSATGSYNASNFSGVTVGLVAGDVVITEAIKNAFLSITAAPTKTITFTGATAVTAGTADALTINVNTGITNNGINANTVIANGYEAISIVSNGATKTTANTLELTDTGSAGTGTLSISGTGKLTLTDSTTRFSTINVTNSNTVDLTAVVAANTGVAITGGTGALSATGAQGGTQVAVISLGGTGASYAINDTVSAVINGTVYTYTVATAAATAATVAAGLNTLIAAGVGGHGVTSTASGNNITLTKGAIFSAVTYQGTNVGANTVSTSLVGGAEEVVVSFAANTTGFTNGDTYKIVINGVDVQITAGAAETAATLATKLAAAINAVVPVATALDARDGIQSAVATGSTVVITGGATGVALFGAASNGGGNASNGGITIGTAAINYATANDSFVSGSGGGTYTVGLGGSWDLTTHKYSSGSETINLTASTAKVDTLKLADGRVVTSNTTTGGTTGFTTGSLLLSDSLNFASAGKTAITNVSVVGSVSAVTGASVMAGVLDPSGALLTALGNLTYTISNGVIAFSATGGHSLAEFTVAQLISAAEILVNSSSTGGINKVAVFSSGGNSYVVASDNGGTLAAGTDAKDTLVQLTGVASSTGFGSTGAQGTIVSDTVTQVTSGALNTGSLAAAVYNQAGFSADTITGAEFGTTSTSVTNLAASAKLTLSGVAAATYEALSITQTGTAGLNSLTLVTDTGAGATYKAINVAGDGLLVLTPSVNTIINSLNDSGATHTLSTIKVVGGGAGLIVGAVVDTALTAIDTSGATGAVTFGSTTALSNNAVTHTLATGFASTFSTTGTGDIFNQASGAGVVTLTASGTANVINVASTAAGNVITANGAGDTITVGTGGYTIVARGTGDIINIASGVGTGVTNTTVGSNATVNIGTANTANVGLDTVNVTEAITGGTSAAFAQTTVNFALGSTLSGAISFVDASSVTFGLLGGGTNVATAQVNVATATTLAQALDLAANYTLLTQTQGTAATSANLAANTAAVDWFQFGGDTYVVAAVNNSGTAVAQTGLDSNDIVVKLTGMIDLTGADFTTEVLTLGVI